jgi:hypothetical protein
MSRRASWDPCCRIECRILNTKAQGLPKVYVNTCDTGWPCSLIRPESHAHNRQTYQRTLEENWAESLISCLWASRQAFAVGPGCRKVRAKFLRSATLKQFAWAWRPQMGYSEMYQCTRQTGHVYSSNSSILCYHVYKVQNPCEYWGIHVWFV